MERIAHSMFGTKIVFSSEIDFMKWALIKDEERRKYESLMEEHYGIVEATVIINQAKEEAYKQTGSNHEFILNYLSHYIAIKIGTYIF